VIPAYIHHSGGTLLSQTKFHKKLHGCKRVRGRLFTYKSEIFYFGKVKEMEIEYK
jgi:hypothetical protein